MSILILSLIKIYLVTWFFTNNDYIQYPIDSLFIKLSTVKNKYLVKLFDAVHIVLGCHKCLALWIGLILTLNPLGALIISYTAHLLKRKD